MESRTLRPKRVFPIPRDDSTETRVPLCVDNTFAFEAVEGERAAAIARSSASRPKRVGRPARSGFIVRDRGDVFLTSKDAFLWSTRRLRLLFVFVFELPGDSMLSRRAFEDTPNVSIGAHFPLTVTSSARSSTVTCGANAEERRELARMRCASRPLGHTFERFWC